MQSGKETVHRSFKVELMSSGLSAGCADGAPLEPFLCLLDDGLRGQADLSDQATPENTKDETQ